jgi:hypothetical protein
LREAIELDKAGGEPPPPARPKFASNSLQAYFDERQASWTQSGRKVMVTDQEMNVLAEEAQARLEEAIKVRDAMWRTEMERLRDAADKANSRGA